jgi:hypothetical protein
LEYWLPSWMRSLSRAGVSGSGLEVQGKIREMRSNERCHHHKRLEAALGTGPLKDLELVEAVAEQGTSLEVHESQQTGPLVGAHEDQPNSLVSGPASCTTRGGSTSGKSPGTGPVHPPSQSAFHSPSCPMSGETRRRPSAVRSHSASATLERVAAT